MGDLVMIEGRRSAAADQAAADNIEAIATLLDRWRGRAEAGEVLRLSVVATLADDSVDVDGSHPGDMGYEQIAGAQLLLTEVTTEVLGRMGRRADEGGGA